jgi:hypothetical protein
MDITAGIIDDAVTIESMKLPNLRYLKLGQVEWVRYDYTKAEKLITAYINGHNFRKEQML